MGSAFTPYKNRNRFWAGLLCPHRELRLHLVDSIAGTGGKEYTGHRTRGDRPIC